jgi:hypothetical protein
MMRAFATVKWYPERAFLPDIIDLSSFDPLFGFPLPVVPFERPPPNVTV